MITRLCISPLSMEKCKNLFSLQNFGKWLLSLVLFCSGCSVAEKNEAQLFLENVMVREGGLYVLMGSKPMSTFAIDTGFPETEEERERYYEKRVRDLKKYNPTASPDSYEDFTEMCKNAVYRQNRRLWRTWEQSMKNRLSPQYKFAARRAFADHKEGLFINVPSTIYVLKAHYTAFLRITGIRFNPDTILEEISDEDSPFWERTFESHYLTGLLFGYGERNAVCFDWAMRTRMSLPALKIEGQPNPNQLKEIIVKRDIKPSDLKLPLFGVYSVDDPTIEKYRKERTYILKELKGGDFIEKIMSLLTEVHSDD
jgi:hypothetical protein